MAAILALLIAAFLFGGSARADNAGLLILRPLAALLCGAAFLTLTWEQVRAHRFLFTIAAVVIALTLLHLIPLPPALIDALPGREIITEIDASAGITPSWRPLSLAPAATWNAFYALLVPLAALLWGAQLVGNEARKLTIALLALGAVSAILSVFQIVGGEQSPLYLYRLTNAGSAVGLFANRNHHAIFLALLIPMLAGLATLPRLNPAQTRLRTGMLAAGIVLIVPLLLVTGSRAGLLGGAFCIVAALAVFRISFASLAPKRRRPSLMTSYVVAGTVVLALTTVTVLAARDESLARLFSGDGQITRFEVWAATLERLQQYFPLGTGVGTFVEIYMLDENRLLIDPLYTNHAHNDWLEVAMTTGLFGIAVLTVLATAYIKSTLSIFRLGRDTSAAISGRLGALIVFVLALASIADYPLRTPALSVVIVIAALWMRGAESRKIAGGAPSEALEASPTKSTR